MLSNLKCLLAAVFGLFFALSVNVAVAQEQGPPEEAGDVEAIEEQPVQEQSPDVQQLADALNNSAAYVEALEGVEELGPERVQIVSTSELPQQDQVAELVEAAEPGSDGLEKLRAALSGHEAILTVLEQNMSSADDVLAVHVSQTGDVTIYTE